MRITKIEPQKKNPNRRNIYLDGEFAVGVGAETLLRFGLRTGDEIGPETVNAIEKAEELSGAKHAALRFLAHRQRTKKEIRDRLREKEFGDEEIDRAIDDLERAGLVNDAAFARMYARDQLALKPTGTILLKRRLLLLGVSKEIVDSTLTEVLQNVNQHDDVFKAGEKYLRKSLAISPGQDMPRLRSKLTRYLAGRGFDWDMIEDAVRSLLSREHLTGRKR